MDRLNRFTGQIPEPFVHALQGVWRQRLPALLAEPAARCVAHLGGNGHTFCAAPPRPWAGQASPGHFDCRGQAWSDWQKLTGNFDLHVPNPNVWSALPPSCCFTPAATSRHWLHGDDHAVMTRIGAAIEAVIMHANAVHGGKAERIGATNPGIAHGLQLTLDPELDAVGDVDCIGCRREARGAHRL